MTSFRDCGMCGGSGRHSFERCFECKGLGMMEDEPDELDEREEDGPQDLEVQLERALDKAFPSTKREPRCTCADFDGFVTCPVHI